MIEKSQIEKWLQENLITQEQAKKMLRDITQQKQETKSNKIIIAISTIGSLFLGIGAILFVASNWPLIPNIIKVSLLIGCTFSVYSVGYLFKYKLQNLPTVGASLFFLGSLLFGATVFLIAQIYNVNADNYTLVAIWLSGVLPIAYAFLSVPILGLSILLSYLLLGLFLFEHVTTQLAILIPILYLLLGVLLFLIGSLHYFSKRLEIFAPIYRIFGLNTIMFCLFTLSFKFIYSVESLFASRDLSKFLAHPTENILFMGIIISSILIMLFWLINIIFNPSKSKTNLVESIALIIITLSALLCFFVVTLTSFYVLLFNFILLSLIFLLITLGYQKEDSCLVSIGMIWLVAFIAGRYFDFFWDLMPRALFFIIGGLILVICGIILERKRRELKNIIEQRGKHSPFKLPRKKYLFLFFGFFWFVIISSYILIKEYTLRTGQEIILKTTSVGPRDLFRGDYVVLNYPISKINTSNLPTDKTDFKVGDNIFVELATEDGYAKPTRISSAPKQDTLAIKGTIKNVFDNTLSIEYGIESYFVPEGKGKGLGMTGKNISVKAVISKSGKAIIKSLLIDGKKLNYRQPLNE